jgi:hypothetical protein
MFNDVRFQHAVLPTLGETSRGWPTVLGASAGGWKMYMEEDAATAATGHLEETR